MEAQMPIYEKLTYQSVQGRITNICYDWWMAVQWNHTHCMVSVPHYKGEMVTGETWICPPQSNDSNMATR